MVAPNIVFRQFDVAGTSPSGERAQDTHASFVKQLGTTTDTELDYGINNITSSGINSATKVVVGHMDSSGDLTTELFNMKFWLPSTAAFNDGTSRYNWEKIIVWEQNKVIDNGSAEVVPTTLPSSGNILRQDGSGVITGSGDAEVTQYIYMSVFTDTDISVGLKGGAGENTFRYRLTADYY